ncbi:MAG: hypothetical protein WDM77_11905 [Steroidobacteraceae bacterium]
MVNAAGKHRVLIVDDHPIVRHGLRQMIDAESDLMVCGEAPGVREAPRRHSRTGTGRG